jgi:hypothetical protein
MMNIPEWVTPVNSEMVAKVSMDLRRRAGLPVLHWPWAISACCGKGRWYRNVGAALFTTLQTYSLVPDTPPLSEYERCALRSGRDACICICSSLSDPAAHRVLDGATASGSMRWTVNPAGTSPPSVEVRWAAGSVVERWTVFPACARASARAAAMVVLPTPPEFPHVRHSVHTTQSRHSPARQREPESQRPGEDPPPWYCSQKRPAVARDYSAVH